MQKSIKYALTQKWLLVLPEYERIRQKQSARFATVGQLCEVFKVHRKDIRKYYERWIQADRQPEALLPHKRGPQAGKYKLLSKEQERTIIKIRRRFNANEFEIAQLIKGYFPLPPSVSTIYRTFKRYPLNDKRKAAIKRYEKQYPGELLHADTYRVPLTVVQERRTFNLFGALDDCTRLCYVELLDNATAAVVAQAGARAFKWFCLHGIRPEVMMTDNGPEFTAFTSRKAKKSHFFETLLQILDVRHCYIRPYRPQTNGKIERFWKIIYNECILCQTTTLTREELKVEIDGFMYRYNYQRRHGGLRYITPLDKLESIANLLPKL